MPYVKSLNVAVEICVRMSPILITVSSKKKRLQFTEKECFIANHIPKVDKIK